MDDSRPASPEPTGSQATPPLAPPGGVRGATQVAIAMALANALGYLLNLVASRLLGPSGFGALGALLGLVLIGNVAALGLQAVTARVLAHDGRRSASEAGALYHLTLLCAAGIATLALAVAPAIAALLHMTDDFAVWWLPLILAPLTVVGGQLGLLQGTERFRDLSLLYVVAAVGKVGGGLVGVTAGGTVMATMAGTAVGASLGAAVGHVMVRDLVREHPRAARARRLPEVVWATHSLLVLFVLTNADVLLARHYLPAPEAGRYAVGAVVAKGAFWLPSFVVVVALPALSDAARRRQAAFRSVAAVAASGVVVTAGCALLGDLVVDLVGGDAYASLAPQVWLFAAAGSLYALAQLLLYSRLAATDRRALAAVWAALLLLVLLVVTDRHDSTGDIIGSVLVAASALVCVGLVAEVAEHRGSRSAAEQLSP